MALYTETVMDHFTHPRNVGEIPDARRRRRGGQRQVRRHYEDVPEDQGRHALTDVKFETFGCGSAIAIFLHGHGADQGQDRGRGAGCHQQAGRWMRWAACLPYKLHCSVLAEESIKAAVKDYYERNGIPYDHSKFPDCEHCEGGCPMV